MKCPKCNGTGRKKVPIINTTNCISFTCKMCRGKKEIDWIEQIVGVDFEDYWKYKVKRIEIEMSEM